MDFVSKNDMMKNMRATKTNVAAELLEMWEREHAAEKLLEMVEQEISEKKRLKMMEQEIAAKKRKIVVEMENINIEVERIDENTCVFRDAENEFSLRWEEDKDINDIIGFVYYVFENERLEREIEMWANGK